MTFTKERLTELSRRENVGAILGEEIAELARIALASLEAEKNAEPVAKVETVGVCWYADNGVPRKPALGTELYTAPPAPVVDADDNFYSWFGREWHEHYQQNQYTTAAKQMLGVMAESAWKAGRRAAMLQGAEPVSNRDELPDGWVLVPVEPTHEMLEAGDEQFGTYDVYRRMIAAAPQQEVK